MKTTKLYKVEPNTWIKVAGHELLFHHLDGMYSYCTDKAGEVVHVAGFTEVEIIDKQ
jgi:hypothetical protein